MAFLFRLGYRQVNDLLVRLNKYQQGMTKK